MAQPLEKPDLPARFASFADFREGARRRIPHFAFEYLDGGIGRDIGLARNYASIDRVLLTPRTVDEGVAVDASVEILGERSAYPFGVAPVGMGGLFHPESAPALAKKAAALGIPFCLSFVASHSVETIRSAAGKAPWHQFYWPRPEDVQTDILARMKALGVSVLMPTLDIPGHQWRERTIRAGVAAKPSPLVLARDLALRPRWALDTLKAGEPGLPNISTYSGGGAAEAEMWLLQNCLRPVGPEEIRRLRDKWDGKLVVKGVMAAEDAEDFAKVGVDGIVVSNHGGRQLDAAPGTAELLPPIAAAVKGKVAILADGGVTDGLDILKLIRLGADFVMVGRLPYYACAALGARGAASLDLLALQVKTTMIQLGVRNFDELMKLKVEMG
ncbi:alpha-hydroxy-acid oxidizing protein [Pikeienuella piscinae]|uniref:Alpha-hydroxy-acid oxidizing protein n=1 Tax=Pikeienuella piscinae TaxID=2748098 RepID=A0A7L5BU44_9RHOB|nr:alpha-hydroxy acid oxidase [Pikeienuella piscinae]QIE55730.1 alpha-hydroxy-acid oxidizing protein [Pikeienuella piscinae]